MSLCEKAVIDCFERKWKRNDTLTFIEKYAGIRRQEFWKMELENPEDISLKIEAIDSIAPMLYETIEDITHGIYPEDMEPVKVRKRPDGMTGKIRDIAMLCILHQLLGHAAKLMLEPLLRARIEPTQHASIPHRGQTALKRQTNKLLRKHPEVKWGEKTDIKSAYKSLKYAKVIRIIRKEIPSAHTVIALLEYLAQLAPGGHLIIGGYLDAWLFNFTMSYAIREMKKIGNKRRGKFIPALKKCITYMDDFGIYASSIKAIKMLLKTLSKYVSTALGVTLKVTTGLIHILSIDEERRRRTEKKPSARNCPCIDMAGYKICRSHITIRRRVFRKTRRQFIRSWKEYRITGTLPIWRAQKIISYNSYITQTDNRIILKNYHVKELIKIAKAVTAHYARLATLKRKEKLRYALHIRVDRQTLKSNDRVTSGRNKKSYPRRQYQKGAAHRSCA